LDFCVSTGWSMQPAHAFCSLSRLLKNSLSVMTRDSNPFPVKPPLKILDQCQALGAHVGKKKFRSKNGLADWTAGGRFDPNSRAKRSNQGPNLDSRYF
jgi:hypothetical protein